MKLEYDLIEDSFDDTTHIRTMTEQAVLPDKGWLIRTTLYTPHQITASVTFVADANAKGGIFDSVVP
ncbi:MAG: hypothetical protein ACE5H7_10945 [Acidiferrobacterales bacterium]